MNVSQSIGAAVLTIASLIPFKFYGQLKMTDIAVSGRYLPSASHVPPKDSAQSSGSTMQTEFSLQGNLALNASVDSFSGKVRIWTASFGAQYTFMNNKDYQDDLVPSRLLATYAGIQHYRALSMKWGLAAFVSAGLYSDLMKVDGNDIFLNAGIIGIRHFSENLNIGLGVIVNNNFGAPLVWPALTVGWNFGGKFGLDIRIPDNGPGLAYKIGVSYKFQPDWSVTFSFKPGCVTYDVERTIDKDKRLMSFWQLPFGLELKWERERIRIFGGGGLMALRSYNFGEKKLAKMFSKYPYHGMNAQLFVNAGIQIKF